MQEHKTIADVVLAAASYSGREAVVFGSVRETYGEWLRRAKAVACYLQTLDVQAGDVVATLFRNSHYASECVAVTALVGGTYLPLNAMLTGPELLTVLNSAHPRVLIYESALVDIVRSLLASLDQPVISLPLTGTGGPNYESVACAGPTDVVVPIANPNSTFLLLYTSGTTGISKGVELSHRALLFSASTFVDHLDFRATSKVLLVNPHFFSAGINCSIIPTMRVGCSLVVLDRFREKTFFDTVEAERITHTQLVPTMLVRLIDSGHASEHDLSSLQVLAYGSSSMPVARLSDAFSIFGGCLVQTYGMTEIPELVLCLDKSDHEAGRTKPELIRSCGRPLDGANVRIVDQSGHDVSMGEEGELLLRGQSLLSGYWKAPEQTKAVLVDGWLHSGDIARMDVDGYIHLVGRLKDIISTGGIKVSPVEVECVLFECPSIADTVVVGVPHPTWGEAVVAFVVPRPGCSVSEDKLRVSLSERLASFKVPKAFVVVASLPKTHTGKPIRKTSSFPSCLLREALAAAR